MDYCGDQFVIYINIKSLCCTSKTNTVCHLFNLIRMEKNEKCKLLENIGVNLPDLGFASGFRFHPRSKRKKRQIGV